MTLSELVAKSYLLATGEVSTLSNTDSDYKKIVQIANIYLMSWATEPNADWATLYQTVRIGSVSGTDTYSLDDSIMYLSNQPGDYVRIKLKDGSGYSNYSTVSPKRLGEASGKYCARKGRTLVFSQVFTPDDIEFGGAIEVPAYITPDLMKKDNDEVVVDDPNWLAYMIAAEWVRNDVTLQQNYPNLMALADNAMNSMKAANEPQVAQIHKRAFRSLRSF